MRFRKDEQSLPRPGGYSGGGIAEQNCDPRCQTQSGVITAIVPRLRALGAAVGVSGTASKLRAMQLAIIIESPLLFEPPRLPNTRAFIRRIEALERAP